MKSLNAKRIAAIVTGAALLGAGLAFAGPLTFQNVPIISNSGQPVVQVVIGSGSQAFRRSCSRQHRRSDRKPRIHEHAGHGMGQPSKRNALTVSVSSSQYSLTNQQVWLNESGVTSATGCIIPLQRTDRICAQPGSTSSDRLRYTKTCRAAGSYAFPEYALHDNSPDGKPIHRSRQRTNIDISVTALRNGGGVTFSQLHEQQQQRQPAPGYLLSVQLPCKQLGRQRRDRIAVPDRIPCI